VGIGGGFYKISYLTNGDPGENV